MKAQLTGTAEGDFEDRDVRHSNLHLMKKGNMESLTDRSTLFIRREILEKGRT